MKSIIKTQTKKEFRAYQSYLPPNFILCFLAFFILNVNHLYGQAPRNQSFSPYANYTYLKNVLSTITYTFGTDTKVGYQLVSGNYYKLYRKALQFNIASIPSNSTVDSVKLSFLSGNQCGNADGTIRFTEIPFDWPSTYYNSQAQFNSIGNSTLITSKSITTETTYYANLASLVQDIQAAIQSQYPLIAVGAYNQYESTTYGTSFSVPVLMVYYTIPVPPAPSNFRVYSKTAGSCVLRWDAPGGNVTGYYIYKNGTYYGSTSSTEMEICNLNPGLTVSFTINAYNGYGVGDISSPIPCTPDPSAISGPALLCTSDSYSVSYVPAGATITWSSSSNITRVSPQNSNPCIFEHYSNGNGTISASITSDCENYYLSYEVHTGPYSSSDYEIIGPSSAECESYVYYSIPQLEGITSINWDWADDYTFVSGQGQLALTLITGQYGGRVAVGVDNTCGQSGSYYTLYTDVFGFCDYLLSISPNPASDIVNITIVEPESAKSLMSPVNFNVSITDKTGVQHYNKKQSSKAFSIPVQNLKDGTYIITVIYGKLRLSGNLIVTHK